MSANENLKKKCIALHVPAELLEKINAYKQATGINQSGLLINLIEKGLNQAEPVQQQAQLYFFVKVRIDVAKMPELGQKLQSGELDTSNTLITYCIKDDPSVGVSIWKANSKEEFENVFSKHRLYYKEVMEVTPVVAPTEAMNLILKTIV